MVFLMIYIIIGAVLAVLTCTALDKIGEEELHSDLVTKSGFTSIVADVTCDSVYRHRIKVLAFFNVMWPVLLAGIIYGAIKAIKEK